MQISLNLSGFQDWNGAVLIMGISQGNIEEQLSQLNLSNQKAILERLKAHDFKAKTTEIDPFHSNLLLVEKILESDLIIWLPSGTEDLVGI